MRGRQHEVYAQLFQWNYSTLATSLVATIDTPGFRSTGPVGVSVSASQRAVSSHPVRLTNDFRHWRRQVRLVQRAIVGGAETTSNFDPPAWEASDTPVPGVSSVFHEATGAWLHAVRAANGQIWLVAWRTSSAWSNPVNTGIRSFATPSITCSPNKCFLAYVEVPTPLASGSTQTRLQWSEGTVAWPTGGNLSFTHSGVTTSWYNVVSDPVASVVRNPAGGWYYYVSTSWPTFSGGAWGTRVLTYRRSENSTGAGALIQMTPLLAHSPGIAVQPTTAVTGTCAELFTSRSP